MATKARQQYFADEISLQKQSREFSISDEIQQKIDGIEEGAQVNVIETVKVNGTSLIPDIDKAVNVEVPEVIDNLYTVDPDNALSAKQGKLLYDYIQNIASRGRFLSNWNSATGLPMTNPSESPYPYKSGDYFVISNVAGLGGINYRPDGSSYIIGQASTVVETESVDVSDFYFYDGTTWLLLKNSGRSGAVDSALSTTSTNPVENRVVTNALNGKQETLIAGNNIQIAADGKTVSATDTTYQASDFDIKDLSDSTGLRTTWNGKQDKLIAGTNIQIAADGKTISSTDTKYTAGTGISIDANNVISNTQTSAEWGNITGTLSDQTDLRDVLNNKQNKLTSANAGTNISIVQSILPDGYTQLSYLGANGAFDLGIKTTDNSRIEALWTKNRDASRFIYSSDSGSTLNTNTTAYSTSGNANWRFGNRATSISTSALIEYLTVQDSSGVTVNGTKYDYATVNTFTSRNNLSLLSSGDEDIIRMQYLKHYNGEDLTLYLVPAKRNSDNAYGFYDLVNDTFFTDSTYTYDVGAEINTTISFVNDSGLALDSEVVHTTGDETIGGAKTFTSGIEVQVNSDAGLNIKSNSAGGYLYVTRGSGGSQVQSEIKSVSSGGAFGTATNHALMLRTNDTTQVTVGTDGSMVLNTDVASNSNNNQVATTKWTNSKLGNYLAKDNTTAFTPSGDYNPATKKYVDDSVADLMGLGKFLSLWDSSTGQPISFPLDTPYAYSTGDYFLVEVVSSATPPVNYRPNGSSYTGTASSTAETDEVAKGDFYVYDGSVWLLATNHGKTVSFANLAGNPSDNTALANALATGVKVFGYPVNDTDFLPIINWYNGGGGVVFKKSDGFYRVTQVGLSSGGDGGWIQSVRDNSGYGGHFSSDGDIKCDLITFTISSGNYHMSSSNNVTTYHYFKPGGTATTGYVVTKTAGGYEWAAPSGGDVVVSSQSGNILTSGMKIWAGLETDYQNLGTYDNNTLYLTIE